MRIHVANLLTYSVDSIFSTEILKDKNHELRTKQPKNSRALIISAAKQALILMIHRWAGSTADEPSMSQVWCGPSTYLTSFWRMRSLIFIIISQSTSKWRLFVASSAHRTRRWEQRNNSYWWTRTNYGVNVD